MAFNPRRALSRRAVPLVVYGLLSAALVSSQATSSYPTSAESVAATTSGQSSASTASTAAASGSNQTTKAPVTHTVDVAKGGFTFVPDVILADVGDTIRFSFFPQNHSVVRAAYEFPCIPYETTYAEEDVTGFFSGFKPVDAILDNPPTFDVRINDSNPIFYYCSAPGSCINYAMVGVINPNASVSLANQKQLAKDSSYMLQPGQQPPSEELPFKTASLTLPSSTSSAPTTASATSAAAATTSAAASGHSGLSSGAIAGIAVGAALGGILIAVLFFLFIRNKALHKNLNAANARPQGPEQSEQGGHYYGSPPSHITGAYIPDKPYDRQSYASTAYQPSTIGPPGYATHPEMPSPMRTSTLPMVDETALHSPPLGATSPMMQPQSPGENRAFSGMATPPVEQEAFEKPANGPHELAASISRAKRTSDRST